MKLLRKGKSKDKIEKVEIKKYFYLKKKITKRSYKAFKIFKQIEKKILSRKTGRNRRT